MGNCPGILRIPASGIESREPTAGPAGWILHPQALDSLRKERPEEARQLLRVSWRSLGAGLSRGGAKRMDSSCMKDLYTEVGAR